MIGTIILTADERHYKRGWVIESGAMIYPPTRTDVTYIVHLRKVTEKQIMRWADIVGYRLVIVIDKLPTLSKEAKESVIIDKSLMAQKPNHKKAMDALFRWSDRKRVHQAFEGTPIPLALSFLRENKKDDVDLWRLLADVQFTLPNEYAEAVMVYGIKPSRMQVAWPKKKAKADEPPAGFRSTDLYWREIIGADVEVRNRLRSENIQDLPPSVKKRKERTSTWI